MYFLYGCLCVSFIQAVLCQQPPPPPANFFQNPPSTLAQDSPMFPQEPPPAPSDGTRGIMIPAGFQNLPDSSSTGNQILPNMFNRTGNVWERRGGNRNQGQGQGQVQGQGHGQLPSTGTSSGPRDMPPRMPKMPDNRAGGMVVPFQTPPGFNVGDTSVNQGGGTPVKFPSDNFETSNALNAGVSRDLNPPSFNAGDPSVNTVNTNQGGGRPVQFPGERFDTLNTAESRGTTGNRDASSDNRQFPNGGVQTDPAFMVETRPANDNLRTNRNTVLNTRKPTNRGLETGPVLTGNTNNVPNIDRSINNPSNIRRPVDVNNVIRPVQFPVDVDNTIAIRNQPPQEFSNQGKTVFDPAVDTSFVGVNRNFNPNLNSALGFGSDTSRVATGNVNFPVGAPGGGARRPCSGALIQPVYMEDKPHVLDILHFRSGSFKIPCAFGTGYSLKTCGCSFISDAELAQFYEAIGYPNWMNRCHEDIYLNFNSGVRDNSINGWYINSHGVSTYNGLGQFNGNRTTTLTIPKYRGYDLRLIAFEFRFRSNITKRNHPHPMITNCETYSSLYRPKNQEPTYGVILNSNSSYITFFVKVEKTRTKSNLEPILQTKFVTIPVNPLSWNTVRYSFDGDFLRAAVNGQKDQVAAKGYIADRAENPISVGHCLRYGNFRGEIDDIKIYTTCIPKW